MKKNNVADCYKNLVDPTTGQAINDKETRKGIHAITYGTYFHRKLVNPSTGKALTEADKKNGIIGIKYGLYRNRKLVNPTTGKDLTTIEKQNGEKGISYDAYCHRKSKHSSIDKSLTEADRQTGIKDISNPIYRNNPFNFVTPTATTMPPSNNDNFLHQKQSTNLLGPQLRPDSYSHPNQQIKSNSFAVNKTNNQFISPYTAFKKYVPNNPNLLFKTPIQPSKGSEENIHFDFTVYSRQILKK